MLREGDEAGTEPRFPVEEWAALECQLQRLLSRLLASRPYRRGEKPAAPRAGGVYLFSDAGRDLYVGQTRNFNQRFGQHTRPSSTHLSAPFAFAIARRQSAERGLAIESTRAALAAEPDFLALFHLAKRRIGEMDCRFVEIDDPNVRTVFEVYAAVNLHTIREYNTFETH